MWNFIGFILFVLSVGFPIFNMFEIEIVRVKKSAVPAKVQQLKAVIES